MIRGFGKETFSTYSQTLNRSEIKFNYLNKIKYKIKYILSGPFLVSRTGDAGCSERFLKLKCLNIYAYLDTTKGVNSF